MIITVIQLFFSKIIRFQAIFKDTVEFTYALEFKISSQHFTLITNFNVSFLKIQPNRKTTGNLIDCLSSKITHIEF